MNSSLVEWSVDLTRPVSLARTLRFDQPDASHFGAPAARSNPMRAGSFTGSVDLGGSCNCHTLHFTPHCDGTHTESVGHLTHEACNVCDVVPLGLMRAVVLSVAPQAATQSTEDSDPLPRPGDRLITRAALERNWPDTELTREQFDAPLALVIRLAEPVGPSDHDAAATKAHPSPYLSRQATEWLRDRQVEHLVVEMPSIDRESDAGRLCAHRVFFGLPPGGDRLADARRAQCTVTELATVPSRVRDGAALLQLALPALAGDAVPSRPLLYPVAWATPRPVSRS